MREDGLRYLGLFVQSNDADEKPGNVERTEAVVRGDREHTIVKRIEKEGSDAEISTGSDENLGHEAREPSLVAKIGPRMLRKRESSQVLQRHDNRIYRHLSTIVTYLQPFQSLSPPSTPIVIGTLGVASIFFFFFLLFPKDHCGPRCDI